MPSIRLHDVAFAHGDAAPVFEHVSIRLEEGWTGVVGANGAGKTTLLGLVAGLLSPTHGEVRLEPEGARVVVCPQVVEEADASVLAFADSYEPRAFRLRGRLGLEPDALARWPTLSPGERKRWQVGAALAADPDVLALDEPTNHLDAAARAWLVAALGPFRGTGLLVTHDRALLDALATRTLRVHAGGARVWNLPYSQAKEAWEAERAGRLDAREAQQEAERRAKAKLVAARQEQAAVEAQRSTRARSRGKHDSDARTCGAKTLVAWAEAGAGRRVEVAREGLAREEARAIAFEQDRTLGRSVFVAYERAPAPTLATIDGEALSAGGRTILRDVRVTVGRADRIHVAGPNGAGKTTLLNALLARSRLPPDRVLWLPQELPVAAGRALVDEVRGLEREVKGRVLSLVAALGADPERVLASASPSPGEARKLALALGLGRHAWLLVLDEPTNHLDLPTLERLEAALAAYPGALVLVSHDERFAAACTLGRWEVDAGCVRIA